jgi:hypothetical protein
MTSSKIRSTPCCRVISRKASSQPLAGGTTPMFPATGSTISAAMSFPRRARSASSAPVSLNGIVWVSAASSGGTPGDPGIPRVSTPDPALTSRESAWP